MNQYNNIIKKSIQELEQLVNTGLVKPDEYLSDIATLRRIEDAINQDNVKQCRLLSKQLKGFSSDVLKEIDNFIEKLIHAKPSSLPQPEPSNQSTTEVNQKPQADNKSQEESKTVESKDSEIQEQPAPPPTQPTPHVIQNQFELGIALGALQKENSNLKEYLDNVVAKQKDLHKLVCDEKEMFININNNAGVLSETMKHIEPLILKITPEISRAAKEIKETLVNALADKDLIKRVTEHQTEVDAMLKKIRDTTNADIDDLYKVVRKSAGTIIDETLGQSQKTIVDSAIKVVETATEKTDKKYTNLIMFGLVGAFACSLLTSAFTAKLVATYSSNNTIEYITKLLNAASDKNKEQQQIKKSKK